MGTKDVHLKEMYGNRRFSFYAKTLLQSLSFKIVASKKFLLARENFHKLHLHQQKCYVHKHFTNL